MPYKPKVCDVCGAVFYPYSARQKRCSKVCMVEGDNRKDLEWAKRTYSDRRERCIAYKKEYNAARREARCADSALYRSQNKEKIAAWFRKKRASDHLHRLCANMRSRIWRALKKQRTKKTSETARLLEMSGQEFMQYLLTHKTADGKGFTAANYGDIWSVDHIKPLASFDLSDEKERAAAFHYSNCQPMLIVENISKGSRMDGHTHRHGHRINKDGKVRTV